MGPLNFLPLISIYCLHPRSRPRGVLPALGTSGSWTLNSRPAWIGYVVICNIHMIQVQ
jgi:hypothetical protein